ncbi:MAG: PRC-barrel domain-containing protein [Alphaproteobacteria bacterium]|nr:PRC-barrel domain-containing protein [Alphaproteobacteria bacterium]
MKRKDTFLLQLLPVALAAALAAGPALAQAPGGTTGTTMPGTTMPGTTMPGTGMPGTGIGAMMGTVPADAIVRHRPRLSQLIGANVYNDRSESIGEVDDIILATPTAMGATSPAPGITMPPGAMQGPVAVIQVGGFLGMGGRLVAIPLSELHWNTERERIIMPNASKETLQGRPAFSYDTLRRG